MIEVNGLSKRYGSFVAVTDVSFKIKDGEIVGFLGPNGAGKSTIMNILTGYLSATAGTVSINGFDILEQPNEAKINIGYLPEQPPLYLDMTVKEYLSFIYDLKHTKLPKEPHLSEICRLVKIEDVYERVIKNLSKGYRQRVGIAQALVGNPDVLILDEPTVGLDPKQIIETRNLIAHLGRNHTVIVSSHILSEIQAICERVLVINSGRLIADDTPENLSTRLSDDKTLVARIIGPSDEIVKLLMGIRGVKNVVCEGRREGGSNDYTIEPDGSTDVRRAIFERLAERRYPMLMLRTNELTLEQIFLRLTAAADRGEILEDAFSQNAQADHEQEQEPLEEAEESVQEEANEDAGDL